MLTVEEYASYDAVGLAQLIRSGEVEQSEVDTVAARAVEVANERLRASVEGPWALPLDASGEGVFAGVPFVVKDNCRVAGVPRHLGSRALSDGVVLDRDSELMARSRRAGLRAVCTTTMPEFALSTTTEPLFGGPTYNPWDPTKSPGGSSGGSAALVAAGAVPIGQAGDGAGSIRIPACHTGIIGLKTSRGRIPIGPDVQELIYGNVVEFAVTRTVRDTAAMLDVLHGWMPGEKYSAPAPARPFREELSHPSGPLRISWCPDAPNGYSVHPDVTRTMESTYKLLVDLGHHVEVRQPAFDWEEYLAALTVILCAGIAALVAPLIKGRGIDLGPDNFEATTIACVNAGLKMTPVDLACAFASVNALSRQMGAFMADWDAFVTPTALTPPMTLGSLNANDDSLTAQAWVRQLVAPYPMCAVYNVTGAPAISLPLGATDEGLPIGVQFGADMYREDLLLGLAAQLEQAQPWANRRPKLHVASMVRA